MLGDVNEAEVDERRKHIPPLFGQRICVVRSPQLEAGKHEEEREHVDRIQSRALVIAQNIQPQQKQSPDLRIGLLQQEGKPSLCDAQASVWSSFDKAPRDEELFNALVRPRSIADALIADAGDDKV